MRNKLWNKLTDLHLSIIMVSVPVALIILITISQHYNNRDKHLLPANDNSCQCECKLK